MTNPQTLPPEGVKTYEDLVKEVTEYFVGTIMDVDNGVLEEQVENWSIDHGVWDPSIDEEEDRGSPEQEMLKYEKFVTTLMQECWMKTAHRLLEECQRIQIYPEGRRFS